MERSRLSAENEKGVQISTNINADPSMNFQSNNNSTQIRESNKSIWNKNENVTDFLPETSDYLNNLNTENQHEKDRKKILNVSSDIVVAAEEAKIYEENKKTSVSNFTNDIIQNSSDEEKLLSLLPQASINEEVLNEKNRFGKDSKQSTTTENQVNDPTMPDIETITCPKGILRNLAESDFNIWNLDRDGMVEHIEYMYHDLGITKAWKIPRTTLKMFLLGVRERYQDNPYHNFKHCFCVTQMAYSMLCKLRLRNVISVDYVGALLTAAVCHDVDHPGLSNTYHCHARTPLAILYNYKSILEQHHFAVTCRILSNKERNIFRNVTNRDQILTNIGKLILATDLCHHKAISEGFNNCLSIGFNFKNSEHVMALLKIIIKCADVSNEVRPESVAGPWVERLFAEYYEQSAREKREHLPVTPHMDPDIVIVSQSQENFIRGVMLPLYQQLGKLSLDAADYYINPLFETLTRYEIQNNRSQQSQL